MGIAVDPNQTLEVTVANDGDRPADARPRFKYRHLTAREDLLRRQLAAAAAAAEGRDFAEYLAKLAEALAVGLVGWEGATDPAGTPVPFDPAKVDEVFRFLTAEEAWDLLVDATAAVRLSEESKKKSRSPRSSEPASSPPAVPPVAAHASPTANG